MLNDKQREELCQSLLWGNPFRLLNEALRISYEEYHERAVFVTHVLRQRFGIRPEVPFHTVFLSTASGFVYDPGPPTRKGETTFQESGLSWIHPLSLQEAGRYMPDRPVKPASVVKPTPPVKKVKGAGIFGTIRG